MSFLENMATSAIGAIGNFFTGGESGEDTHVPPYAQWSDLIGADFQARSKSDGKGNWTYTPEDGLVAAFGLPAQPYAGSNVADAGVANGISTTTPISVLPFPALAPCAEHSIELRKS
jgi:hypothetical protein